MRTLVISDIHANLVALETVLEDARGEWDQIWCLGDIVGYGPDPNECAELLRQHEHLSLSGNHDWAVLGKLDIDSFNSEARFAIRWTQETISEETRAYLAGLPSLLEKEPFTLAHASPRQPVWEYILDEHSAAQNFAVFNTAYCFVGHTHIPVVFTETKAGKSQASFPDYGKPLRLGEQRLIINPGSVGQPRDSDPRAAYGLLDIEAMTWEPRRVDYDIAETQDRMRRHGMPFRLIARLEVGW
jgi:predicted phosphodiesterase